MSRATPTRRRTAPRTIPALALVPAVLALAFLVLPLVGLTLRAPWGRLGEILTSTPVRQSLTLSLWTSLAATAIAVVLGVPLAWLLARGEFPARRLVQAAVTLPLVLPPVVGGVALLGVFGRCGLLGASLYDAFGITITFTPAAVILAQVFVAMPFLVVSVEGALRGADLRFDEAAASLGASRWTTMRRVTLPLIAPSVAAGAVLTWARALGELGATITFAGSFPGRTQTLPLTVYSALETDPDAAIALSLVLLVVCLAVLVVLRGHWLGQVTR
ncbi:MAG: molybdate ABC transporter permease subunit [Actinomycetales bacterium]|nr:molybdate ABC transporter permease subunit [Actinomycetales bacterium]